MNMSSGGCALFTVAGARVLEGERIGREAWKKAIFEA